MTVSGEASLEFYEAIERNSLVAYLTKPPILGVPCDHGEVKPLRPLRETTG